MIWLIFFLEYNLKKIKVWENEQDSYVNLWSMYFDFYYVIYIVFVGKYQRIFFVRKRRSYWPNHVKSMYFLYLHRLYYPFEHNYAKKKNSEEIMGEGCVVASIFDDTPCSPECESESAMVDASTFLGSYHGQLALFKLGRILLILISFLVTFEYQIMIFELQDTNHGSINLLLNHAIDEVILMPRNESKSI